MIHFELGTAASMLMIYQEGKETGGRDLLVINLISTSWSGPKSLHPQHPE